MLYLPFEPQGPLAPYVEAMFYIKGYQPEHSVERIVPDGSTNLVIELDGQERFTYDNDTLKPNATFTGAWLSGIRRQMLSISALPDTELMAVRFAPGGAWAVLREPVHRFSDRVVDAREVFGGEVADLREALVAEPDPEQKLARLARWLQGRIGQEDLPHPAVMLAVEQLRAGPTAPNLKRIVAESGYSHKQFIALFRKYVGLTPKYFQRILKFNEILPKIRNREKVAWAQLSIECGYADQSHFIRDFRHFSGYNPSEFLDRGHDRLNFFPVD